MIARTRQTRTGYVLSALAAPLLLVGSTAGQSPAEIEVTGVVRDFRESHVDMNVSPVGGTGHYAGNLSLSLVSGRPALLGTGARVSDQWRDEDADPIAPHLYMQGGVMGGASSIPVAAAGNEPSHGLFDTWDSSAGPYGGTNVGPKPNYLAGASMPTVTVPAAMLAMTSQGDKSYNNVTFNSNQRFDSLTLRKTLTVDGHVTILCDTFHLHTHAEILMVGASTLTVYSMNGGSSWNHVEVNVNTGDPSRVTFYNLGTTELMVHNHAEVYARFISPNARLSITNHGAVFGSFVGDTMDFGNHGDFRLDTSLYVPMTACGNLISDIEGTFSTPSTGGVDSASSYQQWFDDYLGVNLSVYHKIKLRNNGSGVYEYHDDAFYPVDNRLFGNEGAAHNHYFTFSFSAYFQYEQCADQFFEFEGADDCWVFINDQLALDLGGILPGTEQVIPIDRLGLVDGQPYQLRLFYAQRQGSQARFHVRTNLQLQSSPFDSVASAGFD